MEMMLEQKYKQTEVGALPVDWAVSLLDDNSKRGSGHTPNKRVREYYEGNIVWISLADSNKLDCGIITESEITISKKGIANSSATLHPKGIVLMSRDAGIGKSAIAGCDLCVSQHFMTWLCNERTLHNWYLYYWLQYRKPDFERIAIGSTIKTIGLPFFKQYKIPLPKYQEQTAIANALSDTDALISGLKKLIAKKRNIKQSAMQELLRPKEGWKHTKLEALIIRMHKTKHQSSHGLANGKYPFFTNSSNDRIDKFFDKYDFDTEAIIANTGGVAFFKYFKGKFACMSDCFVFHATENVKFIFYFLKYIENSVNENCFTGSGIKHLDKRYFEQLEISLPTREVQANIVDILTEMDFLIDALERKLAKYNEIKQGMMQVLLRGKVRLV